MLEAIAVELGLPYCEISVTNRIPPQFSTRFTFTGNLLGHNTRTGLSTVPGTLDNEMNRIVNSHVLTVHSDLGASLRSLSSTYRELSERSGGGIYTSYTNMLSSNNQREVSNFLHYTADHFTFQGTNLSTSYYNPSTGRIETREPEPHLILRNSGSGHDEGSRNFCCSGGDGNNYVTTGNGDRVEAGGSYATIGY